MPDMNPPLRYVPRTMRQHGAHSGYDCLFRYMNLPEAATPWAMKLADKMPQGLAWRLWTLRPQATQGVGLRAEMGAMPWLASGSGRWCHFIYGEDTYLLTPLWQRGANRSIATFHYPPRRLAFRVNPGSLKALRAAVIVGENQRSFLEELLPPERIFYCPHAVDTDFFCPAPEDEPAPAPGPVRVLCAGMTFRDYAALKRVLLALRAAGCAAHCDVVGPADDQLAELQGAPDVRVHRGISDEALRALYRQADVGVLPLTDATANNALLEMMACGRPVVASKVGGLPSYAAGSAVHLVEEGDIDRMASIVRELLEDPERRTRESQANRQHALEQLSNAAVARRMRGLYERCFALG